jgi:hypothetical protein
LRTGKGKNEEAKVMAETIKNKIKNLFLTRKTQFSDGWMWVKR